MTTLAQYRAMLRTNKHRLDDELEKQADTQDRIAQEVNRLTGRADALGDELKRVEARLTEDFRAEDPKATVDRISSKVRRDRERITAWERAQTAQEELRDWSNLLDAWKVKGFTLRDLGALYGADYFSLTQVSLSVVDRHVRDLIDHDARDALRNASAPATRTRVKVNPDA